MKRDLLIAGILVVFAGLGITAVVLLPTFQTGSDTDKTVKPNTELIAQLPKKEEPKPAPVVKKQFTLAPQKKTPVTIQPSEKKIEPAKKIDENKVPGKVEPEPKKIEVKIEPKKIEPKVEVKVEPKKEENRPVAKIIRLDDHLIKLNDPDGEYVVKTMHGGTKIELIGTIKTLKIADINERSLLDVSGLKAEEIIFTGNVNSGSTVVLGKAKTLKIRDVNDKSSIDGSALEASDIVLTGAINSGSSVKLHAIGGTVEILGEVNERGQLDIAAPDGKVVFKSRGDSVINGNAKLTILARDVEFGGAINGPQTQLDITLTKGGSLKVRRVNGGVRLDYRKAEAGDPEPRIDADPVTRAQLRLLPPGKK